MSGTGAGAAPAGAGGSRRPFTDADGTPVCELHEYDAQERIERVQALYRELAW